MRFVASLALLGVMAALFMTFGQVAGEHGQVVGSDHDLGVAGYASGVSPCELCHFPHDASGESLWAESPHAEDVPFSQAAALCYSCHDGTVTAGNYAFDLSLEQHPTTAGKTGEGCAMCHDPHIPDYGYFLLFPAGANLCRACHAHSGAGNHPTNVEASDSGSAPEDLRWSPNEGDFSGTRPWDAEGSEAGGQIKCLSCHAAHGGVAGTELLSMGSENVCQNCHP